ncbi:ATP-binding protein [Terasakiella sp.]|uniref:ATP-binding protein n=1 Tax=Terasakiella sp. TaxID=2034861 RepID=UPI003AA88037
MMNFAGRTSIKLHQPGVRSNPVARLIGEFMPEIGTGLFIGDSGIGKTFTALAMATSLATGKPFFGKWKIAEKDGFDRSTRKECGATLFVLSEGLAFFEDRIDAAYYDLSFEDRSRLLELGFSGLPIYTYDIGDWQSDSRFQWAKQQITSLSKDLKEMEGNVSLDLIVLDTLSGVFSLSAENDAAIVQRSMNKLIELSNATGAFVLGITHPAKGRVKSEARGSVVFGGTADLKITAVRIGQNRTAIYLPKVRDGAGEKSRTEYELHPVALPIGQSSMVARVVEGAQTGEGDTFSKPFSKYKNALQEAYEMATVLGQTEMVTHEGETIEVISRERLKDSVIAIVLEEEAKISDPSSPDSVKRSVNRAIQKLIESSAIKVITLASGDEALHMLQTE